MNSTPPTPRLGRNVRGDEFTGLTHRWWRLAGWVGLEAPGPHRQPPGFDPETYHRRNVVERGINKDEQFRAVATRYDREYILAATIDVASIRGPAPRPRSILRDTA